SITHSLVAPMTRAVNQLLARRRRGANTDAFNAKPPKFSVRCCRLTSQNIVVLFLLCNNIMYACGTVVIYNSNEHWIARSFFILSFIINCVALFGVWTRRPGPVLPCYIVYMFTFIVNCVMAGTLIVVTLRVDYEHVAVLVGQKTDLEHELARMVVRFVGYCCMCSSFLSLAYLWVLCAALATIRQEYGRDEQVMDAALARTGQGHGRDQRKRRGGVHPSAPPACDDV
ncbi:hypothetical protein PFISCL1PPCAC_7689, partial [Pristionchus fissidentatus]